MTAYDPRDEMEQPVKGMGALTVPHAAAAVVIGALVFLILIRRGFRGVSAGGVGVSLR